MTEYLLTNKKGLSLVISSFGAGVRALSLGGKKLILELNREKDYRNSPMFFGKTLGRDCGQNEKKVNIDSNDYELKLTTDNIVLHSRNDTSLSFKDFESTVSATRKSKSVTFFCVSPELENGYLGNLTVKVIYTLLEDENTFIIEYRAKTDKETIVNLSNHIYWSIDEGGLNNQFLYINSSKISSFKDNTLLVDEKRDIIDEYNFEKISSLKEKLDISKTLDQTYIFKEVNSDIPQIILTNNKIKVSCFTDYSSVNVFADTTKEPVSFANGQDFTVMDRRAIVFEPQNFIKDNLLLTPDEEYSHFIKYTIEE